MPQNHILLIEDNQNILNQIADGVQSHLKSNKITVERYSPDSSHNNPIEVISELLKKGPILVVTDYDLTENGVKGLLGPTIVDLCQKSLIPVCEYSRHKEIFPDSSNLFNIYLLSDIEETSHKIASICSGFKKIKDYFNNVQNEESLSYATALADLLDRDYLYYEFSKYIESYNKVNQSIIQKVKENQSIEENSKIMNEIFGYVIGHVLLNTILRYPGPIISEKVLCAYVATCRKDSTKLEKIFEKAKYIGPFNEIEKYYWLEDVDKILEDTYQSMDNSLEIDQIGEFNHALIQQIESTIRHHDCERCNGKFGGYYCPFTDKTVCDNQDCSIVSDRWLPNGANLCRIHRSYYDGWEPLFQI